MSVLRRAGAPALALAAVMFAITASDAGAHARRASSTPDAGEILAASPAQVQIMFTQDIQKITGTYGIDVINGAGEDVATADAVLSDEDRSVMTVELPADLPPGRYVVEYMNVSDEDGDEYAAAYPFYVGREPTAQEAALDAELLEQEGGEGTPTPDANRQEETPANNVTPTVGDPVTQGPVDPGDGATEDDDDGGDLLVWFVVGAILLVAVLIVAGYVAFSRRRAG